MHATIRNLWGEEQPAELDELSHGSVVVAVPGLGHLVFNPETPAGARAVLTQGPGRDHDRDVKRLLEGDDPRYEIELLPNSSGEDRIVVVVRP